MLGLWIAPTEGAVSLTIFGELKARGMEDCFIACVDGLKGLPEAIETVFPHARVQLCVVHQVRKSLRYVPWKERSRWRAACAASIRRRAKRPLSRVLSRDNGAPGYRSAQEPAPFFDYVPWSTPPRRIRTQPVRHTLRGQSPHRTIIPLTQLSGHAHNTPITPLQADVRSYSGASSLTIRCNSSVVTLLELLLSF